MRIENSKGIKCFLCIFSFFFLFKCFVILTSNKCRGIFYIKPLCIQNPNLSGVLFNDRIMLKCASDVQWNIFRNPRHAFDFFYLNNECNSFSGKRELCLDLQDLHIYPKTLFFSYFFNFHANLIQYPCSPRFVGSLTLLTWKYYALMNTEISKNRTTSLFLRQPAQHTDEKKMSNTS